MNYVLRDQLDIDLASFLEIRKVAKWSPEHPTRESGHSEGGLCGTRLAQDVKQE